MAEPGDNTFCLRTRPQLSIGGGIFVSRVHERMSYEALPAHRPCFNAHRDSSADRQTQHGRRAQIVPLIWRVLISKPLANRGQHLVAGKGENGSRRRTASRPARAGGDADAHGRGDGKSARGPAWLGHQEASAPNSTAAGPCNSGEGGRSPIGTPASKRPAICMWSQCAARSAADGSQSQSRSQGHAAHTAPHLATHAHGVGAAVRDLQAVLGHIRLETTMRWLEARPAAVRSPLNDLASAAAR